MALAIITIIFAAVLPQFRAIKNGWDSRQAGTEVIQNGRILMDHISRNLSKAVQITTVSNPTETNGYIQFLGNDGNTYRYDINSTGNYVRYGRVGYTLSDLAGPVSSMTFTCYDVNNLDTPLSPVTDVNVIRTVKVDVTITSSDSLIQDKTFPTWAYLRTDANNGGMGGCWKLNETSGTTAADSSGKGNNGTLVNMATPGCWVSGQISNALTFDGTDDYVDLETNSSLNFGSSAPFTVSAWVKIPTTENYGMIVSFRSSTDDTPVIDLAVGYDGGADSPGRAMILVRQNGGSGYARVTSAGAVSDGLWHHIAAVRGSGSTIELFVDGVSQGTNSGADSGGAITTNLRAIGSERRWVSAGYGTADQRYLAATIDDVRVYNRALGAAEIITLANILTYRGFSDKQVPSDSNIAIVISKPSGTALNDLLIAAVATDESSTPFTPPSGWAPIDCTAYGTAVTLGTWWKKAGGSEPASYTFQWTGGQQAYGWIMRFTGYDAVSPSPINTSAPANQNIANPTSPAVTTTVPNCLILRLGAFDDDDITVDDPGLSGHSPITMDESAAATTPPAPVFVAAGAVTSATNAITPALPAGIAVNDILLLFLETSNQAITIPTPNGGIWTAVTNSPQSTGTAAGATGARLTVFWSRYNGTQGNPTTSDSGNHQAGRIIAIRGAITSGDPWNITAGGVEAVTDTSGSIPGAITTVNNTLVVTAIATALPDATGTTNFSAWTNGNLTGITERTDDTRNSGNGGGLGIATGVRAAAGAYGNTAVTCATASYKAMMSIAIRPPAAVTGTVAGGAGYIKQSAAGLSSGTPTFLLPTANEARMLTIAIAPDANGSFDCCGEYLYP